MTKLKFNIHIKGDKWKVLVIGVKRFQRKYGSGCDAVTLPQKKKIVFIKDGVEKNVVLHELFHAYFSYQLIESANLSMHQMEEVAADVFAEQGKEILKLSTKIYKYIKKELKK